MIIGEPRIEDQGDALRLAASVEYERPDLKHREDLWFCVPVEYREYLSADIDAFAMAMLPSAMCAGERLRLEAPISPRLAWGLREYQQVQRCWFPDWMHEVEIEHAGFEERRPGPGQTGVGATFSGGLDSFYTLYRQRPQAEALPDAALTHCVMINGFDKDNYVSDPARFARLRENYRPLMDELGIGLLSVESNVMPLRRRGVPGPLLRYSFAASLTAVGFALGALFRRFYIPGGMSYRPEHLVACGSHPALDHLLGSESLLVVHHGADARRVEKTSAVADWAPCQQTLRVCFERETYDERTGQLQNCCSCEKCIRTMTALAAIGRLDDFETFPEPLTGAAIRSISLDNETSRLFYEEVMDVAEANGHKALAADLRYALRRGRFMSSLPPGIRPSLRRLRQRVLGSR